jgi:hypothetical protein
MEIGKEKEKQVIEPIVNPVPQREPEPAPVREEPPVREKEPEKV